MSSLKGERVSSDMQRELCNILLLEAKDEDFKNVTITIFTIVGMAFIMFIGVLFSSLVGKIVSFISAIITEL